MTDAPKPTENAGLSALVAVPHATTAHRVRLGVFLGTIDPLQSYITGEEALAYGERVRLATIAGLRTVPQPPQEPTPEAVERAALVVSPLLWLPLRTGSEAMSAFSGGRAEYSIIPLKEGGYRVYGIPGHSDAGTAFPDLKAAQAATQADFEARILSALTAPA